MNLARSTTQELRSACESWVEFHDEASNKPNGLSRGYIWVEIHTPCSISVTQKWDWAFWNTRAKRAYNGRPIEDFSR